MSSSFCIEACIATPESAYEACAGNADRIELNMALELDGLTPTLGLLKAVRKQCSLPVIIMIRPRSNGFFYSEAEFSTMQADIDLFLDEGVEGFAFGVLDSDRRIDTARIKAIVRQIKDKEAVFHRAFDVTEDPAYALEQLIDCGIQRILTSGSQNAALEGASLIRQLIEQANQRIEILPGGGITPDNVHQLIDQTGCTQVHGTFKKPGMKSPKNESSLSGLDQLRKPPPRGTHRDTILSLRKIVDSHK